MDENTKLSRRELVREGVVSGISFVADLLGLSGEKLDNIYTRPPGSVEEKEFLSLCTCCNKCVEACEPKSIFTIRGSSNSLEGTPVLCPDKRACQLCSDFPCAASCESGALKIPETFCQVYLGTARILEDLCFTFRGPECGACVSVCPIGSEALRLNGVNPKVGEDACVGCGLCVEACPTIPKAIVVRKSV